MYRLLALLVAIPIVEIYVIIQVGQVIGVGWTVLALVLETVLGALLVRREGRRAWRTLVGELSAGQPPTRSAIDGAVILVGGLLLLIPGFVTDFFGFLCVLPFTRPLVRRVVVAMVWRRSVRTVRARQTRQTTQWATGAGTGRAPVTHEVIEGHVVETTDPEQDR